MNNHAGPVAPNGAPVATPHRPLVDRALDELTSWQSHMRTGAFKRWHQGALSLIHVGVLSALASQGPLPIGRVAEALDVSVASATGIVTRMEKRGVVRRRHAEDDRRVVLVEATDAGTQVARDMEVQRREQLAALLDQLTDDELNGFLTGLGALRAARSRLSQARPHASHPTLPGSVPAARPGDSRRSEATHR